ncbi:MAG: trypco2 family protein [Isosphaeraceae bacterium]
MDSIELSEAIDVVRAELITAQRQGQDSDLAFKVGTVDMEFEVMMEREAEAGGKIKVWVVEIGVSGRANTRATHRVRVSLTPHDRKGGDWNVKDRLTAGSE